RKRWLKTDERGHGGVPADFKTLSGPPAQVAGNHVRIAARPARSGIQAGHVAELSAAGFDKGLTALHVDLLEGLEAVGEKARTHHIDRLDAFAPPRLQG